MLPPSLPHPTRGVGGKFALLSQIRGEFSPKLVCFVEVKSQNLHEKGVTGGAPKCLDGSGLGEKL